MEDGRTLEDVCCNEGKLPFSATKSYFFLSFFVLGLDGLKPFEKDNFTTGSNKMEMFQKFVVSCVFI